MQTCENCHVKIRGNKAVCPLCEGELFGVPENAAFPVLPQRRYTARAVMKIAFFVFIVIETVMGTIWYLLKNYSETEARWPSLVMFWTLIAVLDMFVVMVIRYNILKLLTGEIYAAMVIDIMIDRSLGRHGWSVAFVVPSLFAGLVLVVFITAKIQRMKVDEYLIYLVIGEALSFLQIIFIALGKNPHPWFAVISMALMLILFFAELIFLSQDFRTSTARTLHL